MTISKEFKELVEARDREYRERHPLTSEERHKEIMEASNSITLDDYNSEEKWTFKEGESPWDWYDAQVAAMNHCGHIFCIDPFYGNFRKYTIDGNRLSPDEKPVFYGWECDSTEKLINRLKGTDYLNMTIRTIKYLKLNCGVEFPNGWGDQFPKTV